MIDENNALRSSPVQPEVRTAKHRGAKKMKNIDYELLFYGGLAFFFSVVCGFTLGQIIGVVIKTLCI